MNLWILTEERPKRKVIREIVKKFARKKKIACFLDPIRIVPILELGHFTFTFKVIGFNSPTVKNIYIKIVSGKSSFVDFLIFYQDKEPTIGDCPIFAIEETKTDDSESRNTGIFQRATKFVYIDLFYPGIDKTMLYNIKIQQKAQPTQTNIFGSRCLQTLGVEITGKTFDKNLISPWTSIDEMIDYKSQMKRPHGSNTPITIKKHSDKIILSGKLFKSGYLGHDPNIGALSLISATLRKLGWEKPIEITKHGLSQSHIRTGNKFVFVANSLKLSLSGIEIPSAVPPLNYWDFERNSEKLGTIFIHVVVQNFTTGMSIYENHAGCERGYFITDSGEHISVDRKIPLIDTASGHSRKNIEIPDLIIVDCDRYEIINIEGKKYNNIKIGIRQLNNFDAIEHYYIKKYYPDYKIIRTVVLYGGTANKIQRVKVSFLLNSLGKLILGIRAPKIFTDAIRNLLSYWQQ